MCPDPQLLSIYMDGELPSPWKEKMEAHIEKCSVCRGNYENFKKLQEYFKKDKNQRRVIVERAVNEDGKPAELNAAGEPVIKEQPLSDYDFMEKSKERVWRNLSARGRVTGKRRANMWGRSLTVPIPAAAAAAVVLAVLAVLLFRTGFSGQSNDFNTRSNFIFAAEEEEMPGLIPTADMNGVLQYLGMENSDVIILQLPESRNFSRTGEPAMVRAADYKTNSRRRP
jgi:hypothetical protein